MDTLGLHGRKDLSNYMSCSQDGYYNNDDIMITQTRKDDLIHCKVL